MENNLVGEIISNRDSMFKSLKERGLIDDYRIQKSYTNERIVEDGVKEYDLIIDCKFKPKQELECLNVRINITPSDYEFNK